MCIIMLNVVFECIIQRKRIHYANAWEFAEFNNIYFQITFIRIFICRPCTFTNKYLVRHGFTYANIQHYQIQHFKHR